MPKTSQDLVAEAEASVERIDAETARRMVAEDDALVLDVRDPAEVDRTGRAAGALNVARGMLEFRADGASKHHDPALRTDRPVIVYCASGGRAALAGKTLQEMGFARVYNLGGFSDWADAGRRGGAGRGKLSAPVPRQPDDARSSTAGRSAGGSGSWMAGPVPVRRSLIRDSVRAWDEKLAPIRPTSTATPDRGRGLSSARSCRTSSSPPPSVRRTSWSPKTIRSSPGSPLGGVPRPPERAAGRLRRRSAGRCRSRRAWRRAR